MPLGAGRSDLALDVAAPVTAVRIVAGPSRPSSPLAGGAMSWRAINHLALNYLSLSGGTAHQAAAGVRELLELYAVQGDAMAKRQIEGIKSVAVRPVVRRLPAPGPLTFGRGLEITLELDDLAYEGGSAFLLGAVLRHFFARHVSINSFTETVLRSHARGEVHRWVPMWGDRPIL
jgi:type VI secretion system protein ImpG